MTCDHCVHGLRPLEWTNAQPGDLPEFAICLCNDGMALRKDTNNGRKVTPLWKVWCARNQVHESRIYLLEDIYTPQELAAVGLLERRAEDREALLLAAAKGKRGK